MKHFSIQNIVVLFIVLLICSCSSTKLITVEFPKKAKKELPNDIQSLLLVNRTVDDTYSDLETDSLQKTFYLKKFNLDTVINDIQAADTLLRATGELLFESGRYDFVIPSNRFLPHKKNAFFTEKMDWAEVKNLCTNYQTDAVLAVDLLKTRVVTKFEKDSYFDPMQNSFFSAAAVQMGIVYEALFRVYDPVKEKIIVREFFKDTLIWNNTAGTTREAFANFTPVKKGLSEAAIALAIDFSEKISTTWYQDDRPVFVTGHTGLKQAGTFIDNNDWESAMALWKNLASGGNSKSVESKALFNLAVAYELQGDITEAINQGLKSYEIMYRQVTYNYLKLLEMRKKTRKP